MIKVLVADDHIVVRRGVLQILQGTSDIVVADEASTGHEVLQLVQQKDYDIVLLDIAMPNSRGLELLKQLRLLKPELQVLMFSIYPERQFALRTLKAGAAGYLTKESAPDELIAALRKIFQGGKYITLSLGEQLADRLSDDSEEEPYDGLSDREYQVMCQLAMGRTVTEVAAELSLSVKTVSTYRIRVLEKLGLRNNAEIVRYALERGLIK